LYPAECCVHVIPAKNAAQRRIRKAPFARIEAITLIDEAGGELTLAAALPKCRLAFAGRGVRMIIYPAAISKILWR
jgi:hypothetical protein